MQEILLCAQTDLQVARQMDDVEIVDTDEANHDALAAYYADGSNKDHDKTAVFNPYLGLAVEQLNGATPFVSLWFISCNGDMVWVWGVGFFYIVRGVL